ncbi:MAG: protein phosphatase 2C domain-containing protein [Lachnospiraceae bacterium]|nr:protein phosphatase 2C domain-containing protein [Lachnospiraceae bacterium]
MATTLSGLHITRDKIWLFNIGNTRVYSLQNGKYLKQLTKDDSTLNHLLLTERLTEEEAKNFNRKNEITACFGGGSRDLFQLKIISIEAKLSSIVITSDGIHDYVSIDRMEEIITENGISERTCYLMIDEARANGSQDDASILLCDLYMI